jgi:hypothetical protein
LRALAVRVGPEKGGRRYQNKGRLKAPFALQ